MNCNNNSNNDNNDDDDDFFIWRSTRDLISVPAPLDACTALQLSSHYGLLLFHWRRPGPLAASDICFQLLVFKPGVLYYVRYKKTNNNNDDDKVTWVLNHSLAVFDPWRIKLHEPGLVRRVGETAHANLSTQYALPRSLAAWVDAIFMNNEVFAWNGHVANWWRLMIHCQSVPSQRLTAQLSIGRRDDTESMVTKLSPFCGYNMM